MNVHSCVKILETICNQVYWLFLPQSLLLGGLMLVFASYGTIRMHSVIPMPYYFGFPILALLIILVVLSLFPPCSKIHENSKVFLGIMRTLYAGSKVNVRKCKSQRSLRLVVYGMFFIRKSTQTTFYRVVFDFTINLFLLYCNCTPSAHWSFSHKNYPWLGKLDSLYNLYCEILWICTKT